MLSCSELLRLIQERGIKPKKRWGQNFLIDDNIRDFIINTAQVNGKNVLEIGPGHGALTLRLVERAAKVVAVEVDRLLCEHIRELLRDCSNFTLLCSDVLKISLTEIIRSPYILVSNLPYSISSPLFFKLWDEEPDIPYFVVMLQAEVAQRLVASASSKDYGILSVLYTLTHKIEVLKKVSRSCFWPQPDVDSVIVKGVKYRSIEKETKKMLKVLVNAAFRYRRKKLYKALSVEIPDVDWREVMSCASIDFEKRPDALSPEEWLRLAEKCAFLSKSINSGG